MRWCRLYSEFATDPKVQIMPEAMQRRFIMLFCFQADGCLEAMDDETLGFAMHLNATELQKTKELFVKKGFLEGDTWIPRNWEKRQRNSDDTNARVKRYRERKQRDSNGVVTLQKLNSSGGGNESGLRAPARSPAHSPSPSVSVSEGSPEGEKPFAHSTDSPAAQKVRDDAVRRWGEIDIDADIQANELIRTWGDKLAAHGLDKAFRKLGSREKPWAYANTICRGGLPLNGVGLHDPGPTNQPASAHNPPTDIDDFAPDYEKHLAMLRAKGQVF